MCAVDFHSLNGIAIVIIQPLFFDILVFIDLSFIGLSRCWSPAFQIAIHFHRFCSHLLDICTWKTIHSSNTDHDYLVLLQRDPQSVIRLVPCAIGTHVWAGTTSEMVRSWNMSQGSNLFHRLSVLDKVRISWSAASHWQVMQMEKRMWFTITVYILKSQTTVELARRYHNSLSSFFVRNALH